MVAPSNPDRELTGQKFRGSPPDVSVIVPPVLRARCSAGVAPST